VLCPNCGQPRLQFSGSPLKLFRVGPAGTLFPVETYSGKKTAQALSRKPPRHWFPLRSHKRIHATKNSVAPHSSASCGCRTLRLSGWGFLFSASVSSTAKSRIALSVRRSVDSTRWLLLRKLQPDRGPYSGGDRPPVNPLRSISQNRSLHPMDTKRSLPTLEL
jgi:hypothetical protein